ncbi:ABC transporter ATP-binding protein [Schaalia sp. ZJ1691]|uniref:ABC transporter ATP-binding protein n=1 Tax=Schaalia sp. ZJ1691 TaxID=2709404 RepID=UPI00197D4C5A|nr:ABC transporter ATP-binding protein [Schaalia sp. ZJ1691]
MLIRVLRTYVRPYWGFIVAVLVLQFIATMTSLYLPTLNADIIDNGVAKGDTAYIWRVGGFMLAVSVLQGVSSIAATWCAARAAMGTGRDLRAAIFRTVSSFSEKEVSTFGSGSLITRSTNDVQQVQMLVMMGCTMLVSAPMMAIGGIIMALTKAPSLSWLIGVSVPFLLVAVAVIVWRMVPLFRSYQDTLDGINRVLREQLTGIRVIRAFVREDAERERFGHANDAITRIGERVGQLFVLLFPLVMLVLDVTIVGVIWFGGHAVNEGNTEVGTLIAFMSYLMQILMGIVMASFMTIMIPRAAVSAERINEVLATEPSLVASDHPVSEFPRPGMIEFDGVSFSYPGAQADVLSEISLKIAPGTTTAIVGSTGSGKTTMISLIARLVDSTKGRVVVSGVDVRDAEPERLWAQLGFVPQKPFLFAGTVASNLRIGKEDATDDELWEALRIAQAEEFVRDMDGGLDAPIAQGGTNVSGGQRQRLSIARALVRRPPILLFDDSFSALDVATDARLRQALGPATEGITKVIVAQRVSSVTDADQILVLDSGRLAGCGTHEELVGSNSVYREIVTSQLGAQEIQ